VKVGGAKKYIRYFVYVALRKNGGLFNAVNDASFKPLPCLFSRTFAASKNEYAACKR